MLAFDQNIALCDFGFLPLSTTLKHALLSIDCSAGIINTEGGGLQSTHKFNWCLIPTLIFYSPESDFNDYNRVILRFVLEV